MAPEQFEPDFGIIPLKFEKWYEWMVLELGFLGPTEIQQKIAGLRSTLAIADVFQRPGDGDLVHFVTAKRGEDSNCNE